MGTKTGVEWRREQLARHHLVVEYIEKMHASGKSSKEIAAKLCVSESTVRPIIHDIEAHRGE